MSASSDDDRQLPPLPLDANGKPAALIRLSKKDLEQLHSPEYIEWLKEATRRAKQAERWMRQMYRDEYGAPRLGAYSERIFDVETVGDEQRPVAFTWRGERFTVYRPERWPWLDLADSDEETPRERVFWRSTAKVRWWRWDIGADISHDRATDTWVLEFVRDPD